MNTYYNVSKVFGLVGCLMSPLTSFESRTIAWFFGVVGVATWKCNL